MDRVRVTPQPASCDITKYRNILNMPLLHNYCKLKKNNSPVKLLHSSSLLAVFIGQLHVVLVLFPREKYDLIY